MAKQHKFRDDEGEHALQRELCRSYRVSWNSWASMVLKEARRKEERRLRARKKHGERLRELRRIEEKQLGFFKESKEEE